MESLKIDAVKEKIRIYLSRDTLLPYFVIADDVAEFKKNFMELKQVYISEFCTGDFFIDRDLFMEKLKLLTHDSIFFGLGEYIYLTGHENILNSLQDESFNRKIIFVCRGIANSLERLADGDFKFRTNNICRVEGKQKIFSVEKYSPEINFPTDAKNFSELLKLIESGKDFATVQTNLPLENVTEINTFYDAVKNREQQFNISPDALNEEQWQEYFSDENCENYPPEHWRSFVVGFKNKISNPYLKYVFNRSKNFEEYKKNLLSALLDVDDKKIFEEFYFLRKEAVKNISLPYVKKYLEQLKNFPDSLKYLTDNTEEERHAMIETVQGKEKIPDVFKKNYSAMNDYLADFDFGDEEITNYFRRYKKIKLCNIDDENFKQHVREIALTRIYNRFDTRQKILDNVNQTAKLYWLDALGVEFLSYIKIRAAKSELSATIKISRAELPTLTSQNKNFYDEWKGDKFDKNSALDELKHSSEKFTADGKCSAPIYIDEELKIIDAVLAEIKNSLTNHNAEKIILTSDHGASRLAVMFGHENKFKMNSCGEHGGRCCPINLIDEKPNCASEENGWWVLANYDRFAGGRLVSVEVHGGATLEEILVPVIEFTLQKNDVETEISEPQKKSDEAFDFLLD